MNKRLLFWGLLVVLMAAVGVFGQSSQIIRINGTSTTDVTEIYSNPLNVSPGTQNVKDWASTTAPVVTTQTAPLVLKNFEPVFLGISTPTAAVSNVLYLWYATGTNKLMFKFTDGSAASASGALN